MAIDFETCYENLKRLAAYYGENVEHRNEATTRSQLIDTLLYDCLAWEKRDVLPEKHHDGDYADYTFFAPRQIMILEAKREGQYFEVPVGKIAITYKLASICRGNDMLSAAVAQVADYCHSRGIPLAAVCNGHQLMVFIAVRSDGVPYLEGRALVFPSLHFMETHFLELWNAISKAAIEDRKLFQLLFGSAVPDVPSPLSDSLGEVDPKNWTA
jgi:hypothetical protein